MGRRRSYLPADLCAQARVSQEQIYRGDSSDALCDVVFQTASVANVRTSPAGLTTMLACKTCVMACLSHTLHAPATADFHATGLLLETVHTH